MIEIKPLQQDSFHYEGKHYTRQFPIEYYLAIEDGILLGFAKVDLLKNELLDLAAPGQELEDFLHRAVLYHFYRMGEESVLDKRGPFAKKILLTPLFEDHTCK